MDAAEMVWAACVSSSRRVDFSCEVIDDSPWFASRLLSNGDEKRLTIGGAMLCTGDMAKEDSVAS